MLEEGTLLHYRIVGLTVKVLASSNSVCVSFREDGL